MNFNINTSKKAIVYSHKILQEEVEMENKYLIVDFGGTLAKYSVLSSEAKVITEGEAESPTGSVEDFVAFIKKLYETIGVANEVKGLALSMPGAIDTETGLLVTAGSFVTLYGMNVKEVLADVIPVPVSVENDGKCGALAEVWKGNMSDCQDGIVIIIGTGIAGGIIKDRRVHKGKNFTAGEFSYLIMDDNAGYAGSALGKCGVAPLLFEAQRQLGIDVKKSPGYPLCSIFMNCEQELTELNDDPSYANGIDGYKFFELLETGNEIVSKLYEQYVKNLARLVLNLSTIYNPEKILIGGGVSRQERLVEDIKVQCDAYNQTYMGMYSIPFEIERCKYENDANQYGALYHFLQENGGI